MPRSTDLSQAKTGDDLESPKAATTTSDADASTDNSASTLIEAPVKAGDGKLQRHEFPEGGGSGGAEAFRRKQRPVPPDAA